MLVKEVFHGVPFYHVEKGAYRMAVLLEKGLSVWYGYATITRLMSHMAETTMPVAEAIPTSFDERNEYEFAFHVLPTATEGEVTTAFDAIKAEIAKAGEITHEEAPERIELAYPIIKSIEGKNRKFNSAYFGWVRFKLEGDRLKPLTEELASMNVILRHLLIRLTKEESAQPFKFHEHRKSVKMVEVVNEEPEVLAEVHTETEERVEVSEKALDESLEKITGEGEKDEKKEKKEE